MGSDLGIQDEIYAQLGGERVIGIDLIHVIWVYAWHTM